MTNSAFYFSLFGRKGGLAGRRVNPNNSVPIKVYQKRNSAVVFSKLGLGEWYTLYCEIDRTEGGGKARTTYYIYSKSDFEENGINGTQLGKATGLWHRGNLYPTAVRTCLSTGDGTNYYYVDNIRSYQIAVNEVTEE